MSLLRFVFVIVCLLFSLNVFVSSDRTTKTELCSVKEEGDVQCQSDEVLDSDSDLSVSTQSLLQELRVTEQLIGALQKKAALLSQLRQLSEANGNSIDLTYQPVDNTDTNTDTTVLPPSSSLDPTTEPTLPPPPRHEPRTEPQVVVPPPVLSPPSSSSSSSADSSFHDFFVARGEVVPPSGSSIVDVQMIGIRLTQGPAGRGKSRGSALAHILYSGLSDGSLTFYGPSAQLLATVKGLVPDNSGDSSSSSSSSNDNDRSLDVPVPAECAVPGAVPLMSATEPNEDPQLAIVWSTGCVSTYKFALWMNGRRLHFPRGYKPVPRNRTSAALAAATPRPKGLTMKVMLHMVLGYK